MKRITTFARIRLAWASTMLVVVPLSPGRFGSHRWIEPIWESCLVIYVSVMLLQIRRKLREPIDAPDDLLVEHADLPQASGPHADRPHAASPHADRNAAAERPVASPRAYAGLGGHSPEQGEARPASPRADAGLGPAPRTPVG